MVALKLTAHIPSTGTDTGRNTTELPVVDLSGGSTEDQLKRHILSHLTGTPPAQ